MHKRIIICLLLGMLGSRYPAFCQDTEPATNRIANFPAKFLGSIQRKTSDLNKQLDRQTERYLQRMMKREERLRRKLSKTDSAGAARLFSNSRQQYTALSEKLRKDTGRQGQPLTGEYLPYMDSLSGSLSFLQKHPQLLGAAKGIAGEKGLKTPDGLPSMGNLQAQVPSQLRESVTQLQALQGKMQDAEQIRQFIRDRKEQIGQYLRQHGGLAGSLGKDMAGMNKDLYYYSQQVGGYREMLNNPDELTKKALSLLNQLPAFQGFMKENSQLAGLFNLPGNYGSPQGLTGLQTRDQVNQIIQSQVAAGGPGGAAALQSNLQSAQSQLDSYKDKLNRLGEGGGDVDMPDFKPNDQKTKTFWKRLEYGVNFQTTKNTTFFPTITDLGLSVGYRLGHSNMIGIGVSYKIGWGSGWNHIEFSSRGAGLRSFVDVKLKGSFFLSGGLEYNYTTPFDSFDKVKDLNNWRPSGLIGISKTVSLKSRVFKKTKVAVLWDFLSYQQIPKTQPFVFRVGYAL